ncbi:MAG: VCBS repeat-containing protein [Planctomycetota bacterium]
MRTAALCLFATTALLPVALPAQFVFEAQALQHFPADGLQALKTSFADFDGDGDPDVVTTGTPGSTTLQRFYRNDGHGVFTPDPAWPDVVNGTNHLVADFDSDGDPDVLLDGAIVRNLGGGVLQLTTVAATGWPVACEDFDGDGVRDLFVQRNNGIGMGVALFRQVGGTFVQVPVPTTDVLLRAGAARDFDGDGDIDLLLAAAPYVLPFTANWSGNDRLWVNNGLGQFVEQLLPGTTNADTTTMAVADFDGDGDHDCALLAPSIFPPGGWELRLNDGLGNLLITTGHLPASMPLTSFRAVDLDGDGDRDLVGLTNWLENDGTAHFTARAWLLAAPSMPVLDHGDVDADGDLDLIVAAGSPQRLLLNLGPGRLFDASRTPWRRATVASGDVDGDGDLDLLTGTPDGFLGINDGTGWFTEVPFPWGVSQVMPSTVQIVDVDGDTDRDVLCVLSLTTGGPQLRLFRNNGSGTFVDGGTTGMPGPLPSNTIGSAMLDADGDGDRDVVLIVRQGGVFLYRNNGAGAFSASPGAFPAYMGWLRTVAVGDLDGDGDIDVLTGDESYGAAASEIHYFANNGAGVFTDVSATRLQAPVALTRSLTIADIDNDGDLDAFAGCWGTASYPNSVNLLLQNNGGGMLSHVPAALPAVLPTGSVALGDLDDDGDVDAVVGTYQSGVRFWRNQGATFVDVGGMFPLPSTVAYGLSRLVDIDDDLDLDLVIGDGMLANVHWNARNLLPCRIGQPLPYAVRTLTSATTAQPFFGLQFARVPLPPFGTLAMPIGAPLLLPPLALTGGAGQVTYPIPAVPGLVGLELVLQSLFLGPTTVHLSPAVRLPVLD